ncbi:MAG: ibpA [Panacagrimonas sp.]|jgi:molecular chaperone IbpA|nr:Hsp20 family protein [Panacagrimonas sp.]MCC2655314.1 ibpA [Panacagrimonas sp.]
MNEFSLAPLFRSSIGFDRFNDFFESATRADNAASYPPYNVEKHGEDQYRIVIAAAGMRDADLDIQVERDVLTITGGRRDADAAQPQYLHRGIAQRAFKLSFRLADYIEVEGAKLENGMLQVSLVRRVPETAKPRRVSIATGAQATGATLTGEAANSAQPATKAA